MMSTVSILFSLFLLISSLIFQTISGVADTINAGSSITDGDTLISAGGTFELGFFSPGNTTNRYLGMWYKNIPDRTIVWVANREVPVINRSGVLKVIEPGILILLNDTNGTVWSSNTSRYVQNPVAQLLNSGNLVVRDAEDERPENFLWQSFDFPTDTLLPGMSLGWNFVTGIETYLSSWKRNDDPAQGEFSFHLDPTGYPQMLQKSGANVLYRMGPWNGIRFSGSPDLREDSMYMLTFVMNDNEVYYKSDTMQRSFITRVTINENGLAQRWTWDDRANGWVLYKNSQADKCATYMWCGAYSICNVWESPPCVCLDRFVPKDPETSKSDGSSGCIRRSNLSCEGDIFLKYSGIKLPDARNSWNNASMTLEECRAECLQNCSCTAYTQLDIQKGSGCLIWYGDLIDIRTLSADGQDIYIRVASSDSDDTKGKETILIASLTSTVGIVLLGLGLFLRIRKMKNDSKKRKGLYNGSAEEVLELPIFRLSTIMKATNHFSMDNKLGEGGFGPVYKGILEGGQEIAVKRLSKNSSQGLDELKNEVISIAKLQHRNLVKLVGFCKHGEESMLIYEYMPNKSLDLILFDETRSMLLGWQERLHIINGIARGLMYLHQDSRLRIIHRDLKASNILLDSDMNPKISDFGLARSFGGKEIAIKTRRVVGTYGYMSPEYALDGLFSTKSDVFSFGVLVLEIISGKRNWGFSHEAHNLNLLGHAWTLYKEGRLLELVDASLGDQMNLSEVLRTIEVGLLCVQQNVEYRPSMSCVVLMLGNEGVIPQANQPGFFTARDVLAAQNLTLRDKENSINEVTISTLDPR